MEVDHITTQEITHNLETSTRSANSILTDELCMGYCPVKIVPKEIAEGMLDCRKHDPDFKSDHHWR